MQETAHLQPALRPLCCAPHGLGLGAACAKAGAVGGHIAPAKPARQRAREGAGAGAAGKVGERPAWVAERLQELGLAWFRARCKVEGEGDCWQWCGKRGRLSLTRSRTERHSLTAAHAVFELVHGYAPARFAHVMCKHGVQDCVHPDHLRAYANGRKNKGRKKCAAWRARLAVSVRRMSDEARAIALDRSIHYKQAAALAGVSRSWVIKLRGRDAVGAMGVTL